MKKERGKKMRRVGKRKRDKEKTEENEKAVEIMMRGEERKE